MTETLSEQLADYRANWRVRVPADRQALMDQHVAHPTDRLRRNPFGRFADHLDVPNHRVLQFIVCQERLCQT